MVDLLDYDVRFGQGFLFSPPRPVRAEALQGVAGDAKDTAENSGKDATLGPAAGDVAAPAGGGNLAQLARAGMRRT